MSSINNGPQIVKSNLVLDLDSGYIRSYSPNVYPNPTDLLGWQYMLAGASCTLSRDTTITRQYGSIPMKMTITGNDPYTAHNAGVYNLAPASIGQTWTVSVWAKSSVPTDGQIFIFGTDANGNIFVINDYTGGGTFNITSTWQRFSLSYTFTKVATNFIQIRLDGTNSGGSGTIIWWDGLQVERASSATTFNPYYFGNTIWKDVSGNSIDFTMSNTTFSSTNKGLLNFNGSSSNAIALENALFNTQSFTIECWARTSSLSQNGFLFEKGNVNTQYAVFFEGTQIKIRTNTVTDGIADLQFTASSYISSNVWFLVSASYINGLKKLYINGTLLGTQSLSGGFITNANGMSIGVYGGYNGGRGYYYTGDIAAIRFYNKALTDTEVAQNYQATKTRFGL